MYQIAASRGSRLIDNAAMADPEDFYPGENMYIKKKLHQDIANFFLLGTVTLSSLSTGTKKNRQVCIRLMWEAAPRAFSFMGSVIKKNVLFVQSFANGVTFSTMVLKGEYYS